MTEKRPTFDEQFDWGNTREWSGSNEITNAPTKIRKSLAKERRRSETDAFLKKVISWLLALVAVLFMAVVAGGVAIIVAAPDPASAEALIQDAYLPLIKEAAVTLGVLLGSLLALCLTYFIKQDGRKK